MHDPSTLAEREWLRFEDLIQRFENAWRAGHRPDINAFLEQHAVDDARVLAELAHIDLEFRMRSGESVQSEEYLTRFPQLKTDSAAAVELIAAEFSWRRRWGSGAAVEDFVRRFPEFESELAKCLSADVTMPKRAAASGPAEIMPQLPGFAIQEEIGRGGMGIVYKALDLKLNRIIALKTLAAGTFAASTERERFRHEAEAIAHLDHSHIVPVFEVGECQGLPYFTMKYYAGGSLAHDDPKWKDNPRLVAEMVESIARAVHHGHQRGILHRDLKPSNILLDDDGRAHVTDFGLAKRFDPAIGPADASTIAGTPAYMAPEQATGRGDLTTATDVYGLGAILYELLTGTRLFGDATPMEILQQLRFVQPVRPAIANPAIPRDLETIALKCLEKQPSRRYQSAEELADDLARFREGRPVQARPVRAFGRGLRWVRRHPARAAAMVLSALLIIGGLTATWVVYQRHWQTSRAADLALREAVALRNEQKWTEALSAVRRAEELLDQGFFRAGTIRSQIDDQRADLHFAIALEKIQLRHGQVGTERHELLPKGGSDEYQQAFTEYGIATGKLDATEVGRTIRQRPPVICEQIVTALDDWINSLDHRDDAKLRTWLSEVVNAADPNDKWRVQMRQARETRDRDLLKRLASGEEVIRQPAHAVLSLGAALTSEGSIGEAVEMLRRVQQIMPGVFWINSRLAAYCVGLQPPELDEALRFAMIAQALRPREPGPQFFVGYVLQKLGRTGAAMAAFRRAADLDPEYVVCLIYLGDALAEQEDWNGAELAYRNARDVRPDLARVRNELGQTLAKQPGKLAEAIAEEREAVRLAPNSGIFRNNLASNLLAMGKRDEALAEFRKAVDADPECGPAFANLGYLLLLLGKYDESINALRRAVKLDPREAIAYLNLGRALKRIGQTDEAMSCYREAIRLRPAMAESHVSLGLALEDKGDIAGAEAIYKEGIAADPKNPNVHCNLGLLLLKSGKPAEALAHLKTGHQLGSQHAVWNRPSADWVRQAEEAVAKQKAAQSPDK